MLDGAHGGLNGCPQVDARMVLGATAAVPLGFQDSSLAKVKPEGVAPIVGLGWTATCRRQGTGGAHGRVKVSLEVLRFGLGHHGHGLPLRTGDLERETLR